MTVTLTIGQRDFQPRLSTYSISREITYQTTITTLDGVEHAAGQRRRTVITFSLLPYTDSVATSDYDALTSDEILTVTYTDTYANAVKTASMRITSNLDSVFGLDSVTGDRYYRGGNILLRAIEVE